MFMGLSPRLEGEEMKVNIEGFKGGDRVMLGLPEIQKKLIQKIAAPGNRGTGTSERQRVIHQL